MYCGRFIPRAKHRGCMLYVLHETPFTTHLTHLTSAKQPAKQSHKTRFAKLRRKTPPQNTATVKTLKNVTNKTQNACNTAAVRIA